MTTRGRTGPKKPDETRQRIIEATVALHEEVGPAATTISAIAGRAGVQRLTVYRHFPDEASVIGACSAHWQAQHPIPDPASWTSEPDPAIRVQRALEALYAYYRGGAGMLEKVFIDEPKLEVLTSAMRPWWSYLAEVAGGLSIGWEVNATTHRKLRALIGHALQFETWRSLANERLDDAEAARLMACAVSAIARDCDYL